MTSPECSHLDSIVVDVAPSSNGCEDCLRIGSHWMHLRRCTSCGLIGCDWLWCYLDEIGFEILSMRPSPAHQ